MLARNLHKDIITKTSTTIQTKFRTTKTELKVKMGMTHLKGMEQKLNKTNHTWRRDKQINF